MQPRHNSTTNGRHKTPYKKNRPAWRVATSSATPRKPIIPPAPDKRSAWGDFTPGNGRTQCKALARSTGKRCGHDALQGATACRVHGGFAMAYRRQREALDATGKATATRNALRAPRRALARIGATVSALPDGSPVPVSPVERGRAWELAMTAAAWKALDVEQTGVAETPQIDPETGRRPETGDR
jgi:hypothetical protein